VLRYRRTAAWTRKRLRLKPKNTFIGVGTATITMTAGTPTVWTWRDLSKPNNEDIATKVRKLDDNVNTLRRVVNDWHREDTKRFEEAKRELNARASAIEQRLADKVQETSEAFGRRHAGRSVD
jgi:hypothetical protein